MFCPRKHAEAAHPLPSATPLPSPPDQVQVKRQKAPFSSVVLGNRRYRHHQPTRKSSSVPPFQEYHPRLDVLRLGGTFHHLIHSIRARSRSSFFRSSNMAVEVSLNSPLANNLQAAIQSKLIEAGFVAGDDPSLAEYVVLMVVNGKDQEQITQELSTDILDVPAGDGRVEDFSRWIFQQAEELYRQEQGQNEPAPAPVMPQQAAQVPGADIKSEDPIKQEDQDENMGDATPSQSSDQM